MNGIVACRHLVPQKGRAVAVQAGSVDLTAIATYSGHVGRLVLIGACRLVAKVSMGVWMRALSSLVAVAAFAVSIAPAGAEERGQPCAKAGHQVSAKHDEDCFVELFTSWTEAKTASRRVSASASPRRGETANRSHMATGITSGFGMRVNPVLGRPMAHSGVDLAARAGAPIRATADGIVEKAQWLGGYGLYVRIAHGQGMETSYGHLSRIDVSPGDFVRKGEVIGLVGQTGRTTGPHLHYEVRKQGSAVDPLGYMKR